MKNKILSSFLLASVTIYNTGCSQKLNPARKKQSTTIEITSFAKVTSTNNSIIAEITLNEKPENIELLKDFYLHISGTAFDKANTMVNGKKLDDNDKISLSKAVKALQANNKAFTISITKLKPGQTLTAAIKNSEGKVIQSLIVKLDGLEEIDTDFGEQPDNTENSASATKTKSINDTPEAAESANKAKAEKFAKIANDIKAKAENIAKIVDEAGKKIEYWENINYNINKVKEDLGNEASQAYNTTSETQKILDKTSKAKDYDKNKTVIFQKAFYLDHIAANYYISAENTKKAVNVSIDVISKVIIKTKEYKEISEALAKAANDMYNAAAKIAANPNEPVTDYNATVNNYNNLTRDFNDANKAMEESIKEYQEALIDYNKNNESKQNLYESYLAAVDAYNNAVKGQL